MTEKIVTDATMVPSSIVSVTNYLSEDKFAFYGNIREKHEILIPMVGNCIISQSYNPTSEGYIGCSIKTYYYQNFCNLFPDDLASIKHGLSACDTIIWRSIRINENETCNVRIAAIKNGEQIMLNIKGED